MIQPIRSRLMELRLKRSHVFTENTRKKVFVGISGDIIIIQSARFDGNKSWKGFYNRDFYTIESALEEFKKQIG